MEQPQGQPQEQPDRQAGNIMDILNQTFQAMAGAINSAVKLAHAPEYTETRVTIDFGTRRVQADENAPPNLEFRQDIRVYVDGKFISPPEVEEIFKTNPVLIALDKQAMEAERKIIEERQKQMQLQRNMAAIRQGAPDKKIILPQ